MSATSINKHNPNGYDEANRVNTARVADLQKLKRLEVAKTVCKVALTAIAIISATVVLAGFISLSLSSPVAPILLTVGFASLVLMLPLFVAYNKIEGKLDAIPLKIKNDHAKVRQVEKDLDEILKNWKNSLR